MNVQKPFQSVKILSGVLLPLVLSCAGFLPPLLAQSSPEWLVSVTFPPMTDRGAPARTAGAGTRGTVCINQDQTPLTGLMPTNNVGKTVVAHPTFFWYVPATTAKQAEFSVFDEEGNQFYQTTVALAGTPGIIKLSLPETASLEVGKMYEWEFAIVCDPQDWKRNERIGGWSERVELSLALQMKLEQATPLEQAKLYAENQIWHETASILAQLRPSNPDQWEELLKSVDLEAIASAPFVNCCTAQNQAVQFKKF